MATTPTRAPLLGEPLPVELMNTVWADRDGVHEALASPDDAAAWLRAVATRPEAPADLVAWLDESASGDLASLTADLRRLRDAARRLAARRTDDTREPALDALSALGVQEAVATVNALAAAPAPGRS